MAMMGGRFGAVPTGPAPPVSAGVWRRVVVQFRPYRTQVIVVSVLILITSGLGVINPLLIEDVFNEGLFPPGQDGPDMAVLVRLVVIMASITIIAGVIGLGQTYLTTKIGQHVMRDLRSRLYAHLQEMPLSFFTTTRTGEIQSRIANDVGGVQSVVTNTASTILANVVTVISSLVAMVIVSWQLTLVSLVTIPLFYWLTKIVGDKRRAIVARTQVALADMSAITQETLSVSGVLLSKVFGRQEQEGRRYRTENQRLADLELRGQMVGQSFFTTVQVFFSLTPVLIYLLAGVLLNRGSGGLSAGAVVAFTTLQTRLYFPIGQLLQVSVDLRSSLALFDRIFAYLDLVPDIVDSPDARDLPEVAGRVQLTDVDFAYPRTTDDESERPRATLSKVSIDVRPGQLAALVGPSGAGKTTISYLIPRLYDVSDGAVLIDGHDVRDLTERTLSEAIGFVTQESYLFHSSIRDNLLYGKPDATQAELEQAARDAYIHDRIMEFPAGYDTIVGERGYRLSGGEKQRLAIARVLLHDPRILILDEATSALDTESERMVQRALERLMANRTTVAVAHRLSTIVAADVIFVIDRGRVVEQGTHTELLELDGLYAGLYQEQFRGGSVESRCVDGVVLADGTVVPDRPSLAQAGP